MSLSSKRPSSKIKEALLKDVQEKDDPIKRFNIKTKKSFHHDVKMQATKEGRTISEITIELWTEYLARMKDKNS
ncbi:MAG: hypothetical protein MI743_08745 [Sneathiellales bacterium]|nr:hypothetical protein [Sneathiellales bacterium]